jgi:hypothetical protein
LFIVAPADSFRISFAKEIYWCTLTKKGYSIIDYHIERHGTGPLYCITLCLSFCCTFPRVKFANSVQRYVFPFYSLRARKCPAQPQPVSIKRFREITKNCSTVGTFDKCCDPAIFDFVIGPCHVSGIFLPFSIQPNSAVYLLCKRGNSLLQRNPAHMTRAIVYQNSGGKFKFRRIF